MEGPWNTFTKELDSERTGIVVVGEEPCPILVRTGLLNQELVRRTVNEEPEITPSVTGFESVSESIRRVDFVDLKLLSIAPGRQFDSSKEREVRKIIVAKAL
jgi:hypothetical protein